MEQFSTSIGSWKAEIIRDFMPKLPTEDETDDSDTDLDDVPGLMVLDGDRGPVRQDQGGRILPDERIPLDLGHDGAVGVQVPRGDHAKAGARAAKVAKGQKWEDLDFTFNLDLANDLMAKFVLPEETGDPGGGAGQSHGGGGALDKE